MQTRDTAEAVGLLDRGLLTPGYRADLNVIDYDAARAARARGALRPAGRRAAPDAARRRLLATLVAGQVTYRDGEPTGALPGRLVRGAQPRTNTRSGASDR